MKLNLRITLAMAALAVAALFHPLFAGAALLKGGTAKLGGLLIGSLAADRNTPAKKANQIECQVAAGKKIYGGALVAFNATGFLTPGAVATTLIYAGRAAEFVDNTGGADGAVSCLVDKGGCEEAFYFANSGTDPVDQTCLGKTCYIVDDQTVSKTNGTNTQSAAGIVVDLDANGVWVK